MASIPSCGTSNFPMYNMHTNGQCIHPIRAHHLRHALDIFQRIPYTWYLGEMNILVGKMIGKKHESSFNEFR